MDYKKAGVDIEAGYKSVELMKEHVKKTMREEVLGGIGGFSGAFSMDKFKGMEHPTLVSGTDGVGTKLKLAFIMDKHDTVGIDCVAMCVNDIACAGGEPLFFLDYIACGKNYPEKIASIVKGVADGCIQSDAALIGGETAEMPGFYTPGEYDVAGFTVGIVDKKKMIDGSTIKEGDVVLGLPSSGLHSNGYSLARKVMFEKAGYKPEDKVELLGTTVGEAMLKPTRIYVKTVLGMLEKAEVKGMAHITGGGFLENIPRVLPDDVDVIIEEGSWPVPPIFSLIESIGNIEKKEMYRTFNMGIGYVIITDQANAMKICDYMSEIKEEVYLIGMVVSGDKKVIVK